MAHSHVHRQPHAFTVARQVPFQRTPALGPGLQMWESLPMASLKFDSTTAEGGGLPWGFCGNGKDGEISAQEWGGS